MNGRFLKYQLGGVAAAALLLGLGPINSSVAQGRHGGGGGSNSSSSSSSRGSSSSSASRSNSGSSSRSSSSSSRSSSSGGSNASSGSTRTWRHRNENKDNSSRTAKRDNAGGKGNTSAGGTSNSSGNRGSNGSRKVANDSSVSGTRVASDRSRGNDPEGRHRHRRGDDGGRKFGGGSRYRGGDRIAWHRHECEYGRYYYPTTVYVASNYDNYSYGLSAYDHGYEDGLFTGANDAWRGQSFDPERSHFYKHGAGGFLSIFGGPGWYKAAYRDGFLRGYEEGYQNYTSYFIDGRFRR